MSIVMYATIVSTISLVCVCTVLFFCARCYRDVGRFYSFRSIVMKNPFYCIMLLVMHALCYSIRSVVIYAHLFSEIQIRKGFQYIS